MRLAFVYGAAKVLAVDPLAHRRALASKAGALNAAPASAADAAHSIGQSIGFDAVIEIAGTNDAVDLSIELCRPGGRVVLAGIPDGNRTTFNAAPARRKGLTFAMSRRMNEVYPRAIELAASHTINLAEIVSHTFDLSRAAQAMRTATGRSGHKVIICPWPQSFNERAGSNHPTR